MPRPSPAVAPDTGARVQRALYHRCRRGEPEALRALLYGLVDPLYTAASYVLPDEETAGAVVEETWAEVLELLQAPYVGGHLHQKAFGRLAARLEAMTDGPAAHRAVQRAQEETETGLLTFPADRLAGLLELTTAQAAAIAVSTRQRRRRSRQGLAAMGLFVLVVAGYNLWLRQGPRQATSQVQVHCLQERILKQDLVLAVRDGVAALADPQGSDHYEARLLREVGLVLEELANLPAGHSDRMLSYLARRLRQSRLTEDLALLLAEHESLRQGELIQAQLVLEEVENL